MPWSSLRGNIRLALLLSLLPACLSTPSDSQPGRQHVLPLTMGACVWHCGRGTPSWLVDKLANRALMCWLQVGAPAGEMIIVNFLGLWHYERPELFGVPAWAGWCYATYAIGVANVARHLVARQEKN